MRSILNSDNLNVFFSLIRAGLWEEKTGLSAYQDIDFKELYELAEAQSVLGVFAAGLENVVDIKAPQSDILQIVGSALEIEQRNTAMNDFIARLINYLRKNDVYSILVKGQGVGQCYERPLWRSCGDVDLYLSKVNYDKAKSILSPLATDIDKEDKRRLHLGFAIDTWTVELHGTMYTELSNRMNAVSDEIYSDIFFNGSVRSWINNGVSVFLPSPDNDVIIIFNHFINHFYGEGVGLRQICDWCRLLWMYRTDIDKQLLKKRLRKAGLMNEWKSFAALAVDYLGMPVEAMPYYSNKSKYSRKANRIMKLIIETGSFGSNKDNSYRQNNPKWKAFVLTFFRRLEEFARLSTIFPLNAPRFFLTYTCNRFRAVL